MLTLANPNAVGYAYSNAISGNIALTMEVPFTQVLAGANTYNGATTVNGGSLLVNSPARLPPPRP